jgi:hypothetical protein
VIKPETLSALGDLAGFISGGLLAYQTTRLIGHLRTVRGMRQAGERQKGTETGNLANEGADELEKTVSRWDETDQWLVVTGFVVLALSFFLKLAAYLMA